MALSLALVATHQLPLSLAHPYAGCPWIPLFNNRHCPLDLQRCHLAIPWISSVVGPLSWQLEERAVWCVRGGGRDSAGRWTTPGYEERPKGYLFNRPPPRPRESRKWEDWELPCYITSFLTIIIFGVGLNTKPDLTLETWAHQKALESL